MKARRVNKTDRQIAVKEPSKNFKNSAINVTSRSAATLGADMARTLTQPQVHAASIIEQWQKDTHDVNELVTELARQVDAVNCGDLRRAEGMLIAQAHALDNIFANLARRATSQQYLKQWEAYMRMAMKAQNQCRMTLESLSAIKNPPVVFAKQANIANGPQQVNNGVSRAVSENARNQLLEAGHGQFGQRLDARAAQAAKRGN